MPWHYQLISAKLLQLFSTKDIFVYILRYMVAARDLNPLEVILKEYPAVVGPYSNTLPGCLQVLSLNTFFPACFVFVIKILNLQINHPLIGEDNYFWGRIG